MIRHNHKCPRLHICKMDMNLLPLFLNDLPIWTQLHFLIHNVSKQEFPPPCHNGDKISARLGVIVSLQPNGATMPALSMVEGMFLRVEFGHVEIINVVQHP